MRCIDIREHFGDCLELLVVKTHGGKAGSIHQVRRDLMKIDIEKGAPKSIKESALSLEENHALPKEYFHEGEGEDCR